VIKNYTLRTTDTVLIILRTKVYVFTGVLISP